LAVAVLEQRCHLFLTDAEILAPAGDELSERFHNCKAFLTQTDDATKPLPTLSLSTSPDSLRHFPARAKAGGAVFGGVSPTAVSCGGKAFAG
jgi:hypothetical protein